MRDTEQPHCALLASGREYTKLAKQSIALLIWHPFKGWYMALEICISLPLNPMQVHQ